MRLIIALAITLFANMAFADSTIVNPSYQVFSSAAPGTYNVSKYRTKSVSAYAVRGATFGVFTSGTSLAIQCGPTSSGPWTACSGSTTLTSAGIVTWEDAFAWVKITLTKVTYNVKVWLLGNAY